MNSYAIPLLFVASTALADSSADELARCAGISAPGTRLACYDTLAHRPAEGMPPGPLTQIPATAAATTAAATTTAATTAAAQAPTAVSAADPKNFGLTPKQQQADEGPKSIAAHIAIVSSDKLGHTTIVLDGGQAWMVLDDDGRLGVGDAVTIKRAALGSFLMMTPSNHSYRVRRMH